MPNIINERLRTIADNSAIKQSLVPIIICDENGFVCSKSISAADFIKLPAVRGSAIKRLKTDSLEMLLTGEKTSIIAEFSGNQKSGKVILTSGTACNERYFAIIFEPSISFCPIPEPWYIMSACDKLSPTVNKLLETPAENTTGLKLDCARIARLCDFCRTEPLKPHAVSPGPERINHIIRTIGEESKPYIESIGGNLDINTDSSVNLFRTAQPAKEIYSLVASLLFAALLVTKDNSVIIDCRTDPESLKYAKISFTVSNAADGCRKINSFRELIALADPISLELAAIADMAAASDISINCMGGEAFVISCLIPVKAGNTVTVESPERIRSQSFAGGVFKYLYSLVANALQDK